MLFNNIEKELESDVNTEEDKLELEEIKYRYLLAKKGSKSVKDLWEQINICIEKELTKEQFEFVLKIYYDFFKLLANTLGSREETEIMKNLDKIIKEISIL